MVKCMPHIWTYCVLVQLIVIILPIMILLINVVNQTLNESHITIYRYISPYVNGLLLGYFVEKQYVTKIYANRTVRKIIALLAVCLTLSFTALMLRQSQYFGDLPVLTALESGLAVIGLSLICGFIIISHMENTTSWLSKLYMAPFWRPIRSIQQTSYLAHPILAYYLAHRDLDHN
ncbi:unnamed protein product [Medioppia subpectinata]|uniref:Uncharacterized protein n=1 Tax=Medioppia subpectinata TaxID=1979941 RepID=A0A7R9KG62_9ACAR|nr:unnamed protein product [Medioppia subpectinata]CAG2102658.1 unnamed protein product [Medioppia subpectinata]